MPVRGPDLAGWGEIELHVGMCRTTLRKGLTSRVVALLGEA